MSAIALHIKPIFLLSGFRSPVVTSLILFRRKRYVLSRNRTTSSTSTSTRRVTRIFAMAESDSRVSSLSGCDNDKVFKSVDQVYCEIIVVRHGETEWNADGRIQGHLDVDLNDAGRQQAVAVADRLSKEAKISVVYSSDLKRALDTAQIIAKSCGGLEVITDADLRERHLGDLQGLVYSELNKSCPAAYKALLSHHSDQKIPGGGESLDQLFDRCTNSLERIGRQHRGERVVVVTHGGVLRELYKWACPTKMPGRKVLNTSVNIFHFSEEDQWILKTWGDVSHLDQTGYLDSGFGGDRTSGLLSSGLSILMWLHFASSIFGGLTAMFQFELYFGLLVFVGYMVVDTQEIIEKAHLGDLDYVKHSLTLFTDFVAVFVRILIIMLQNSSEKNEKKKKRRN